jgi:hypothetical protein
MRRRLVCLAAIALTATAFAPRATGHKRIPEDRVRIFPASSEPLPMNARIVVKVEETMLLGPPDVDEHHPELRSPEDRVALRIVEKGDDLVILGAERPLRANTSYTLVFDPPLADARRTTWATTSDDRVAPQWLSRPKVDPRTTSRDSSYVDVSVPVAEVAIVRVDLRPHGDGAWRHRWYLPTNEQIRLSNLADGQRYTVKFTAIDFAGNESTAPGPAVQLTLPSNQVAKRR